jgi:hypothetical protein
VFLLACCPSLSLSIIVTLPINNIRIRPFADADAIHPPPEDVLSPRRTPRRSSRRPWSRRRRPSAPTRARPHSFRRPSRTDQGHPPSRSRSRPQRSIPSSSPTRLTSRSARSEPTVAAVPLPTRRLLLPATRQLVRTVSSPPARSSLALRVAPGAHVRGVRPWASEGRRTTTLDVSFIGPVGCSGPRRLPSLPPRQERQLEREGRPPPIT